MFRIKPKSKTPLEAAQGALDALRQELAALQQELDATRAEQAANEEQAGADMHDTPVMRLSAEAAEREAAADAARRLARVAGELQKRIAAAEKDAAGAERTVVELQVADAQKAVDAHELAAAVAMERAMAEMAAAEAAFSAVLESARRHGVQPPKASFEQATLNAISAALVRFARQYSHLRGAPPPGLVVLQNTSAGIRPAADPAIYVNNPYA